MPPVWLPLLAGVFLILLLALETRFAPWSPYFWVSSAVVLVIPMLTEYPPNRLLMVSDWHHSEKAVVAGLIATVAWEFFLGTFLYDKYFLRRIGKQRNYRWSPTLAIERINQSISGISPKTKDLILIFFFSFGHRLAKSSFSPDLFFRVYVCT